MISMSEIGILCPVCKQRMIKTGVAPKNEIWELSEGLPKELKGGHVTITDKFVTYGCPNCGNLQIFQDRNVEKYLGK